jgi:hypothetical protein
MRNMNRLKSFAALLCAVALASCNYDKIAVQDITTEDPGARVKFYHFGLNAPTVNFYANTTKLTAISSTTGIENATGTAYGAIAPGNVYAAIAPGQYDLKAITPDSATPVANRAITIATIPTTIAANKFYSFYLSGFYNTTTRLVEGFVVEDPIPAEFDYAVAHVRFVNAISNSSPMTLFAKLQASTNPEVAIGGLVAYKEAGVFTSIPPGVYDLATRTAAAPATDVITRTAVSFSAGRVYTISARGDITVTGTTATNRRFLDNTANR